MRLDPVVTSSTLVEAVTEATGREVRRTSELDVDVYRLRTTGTDPDLVARVFGPVVARTAVDDVAHVLGNLAETRFPAERCATGTPVLSIGAGVHALLTEYIESSPPPKPGFSMAWCAALLGRLATRPGTELAAGGGWHRLGATPTAEIDEALRLGVEVGSSMAEVVETLADADDGEGLPAALIHADLTPPNVVPQGDQAPIVIDWIGVGRGPRAWPLAFLLYAAGPRSAPRALERYARSVALSDEERVRLPGLMIARPLTLDLWSVAYDRMTARQAVTRCRAHRRRIDAIAKAIEAAPPPAAGGP